MLPYLTVERLTKRLLAIEADAHRRGWDRPPVPLVIVNRRDTTSAKPSLQIITLPLQTRSATARHLPLPHQLHQLAAALHSRAGHDRSTGSTVLLCGVLYHDLHATLDELCHSRRLEALDADGRRYEIVRRRNRPYPTIHRIPVFADSAVPATHSGLADLLDAAGRILTAGSTS